MTTFNTGNPIGSTDARDLCDNAKNMDYLENSTTELTHADRLGTVRKTRNGMEAEHDAQISAHESEHDAQMQSFENDFDGRLAGMAFTRVGSFTAGATLTDMRQVLIWEVSQGGDGHEYGWSGTFPKVVAAGTTPETSGGVGTGAWVDRTDVTLRNELASPQGAELSGFGVDTVLGAMLETMVSPDSHGATGDGSANDTDSLAYAISASKASVLLKAGKKYLVTALDNVYGKPLVGAGHVVKAATGGLEAQTTYADQCQRVTGQENLAAWLRNLYNQNTSPTRQLKIVFSGDSTTEGVGVDPAYQIQHLVLMGIIAKGLQSPYNTLCINKGHSGAHTGQWDDTYVSQDISTNPDLYVVRWGINDPGFLKNGTIAPIDAGQSYPNRRDITDFTASLRSGLAKFRAVKPFGTTSILLMMPNSTYDIPNGRDALWYEQLRNVYVQAARDFQCAFIDTYAIMQDSRHLSNILMDDPMSTSGRGIHPNNTMNSVIAGYIVDMIAPEGFRSNLATNKVFSIGGAGLTVSASLTPDDYGASVYMIRCLTANGWPLDGAAITFKTADNIAIQYHFGYTDADRGKLKVRFGRATVMLGQSIGWSGWYDMLGSAATFQKTAITPASGWTNPASGAMRVSAEGGMRCFDGYITKTTPAVISKNTQIGSFSSSFAPTLEAAYGTATVWSGSEFEQVPITIVPDGTIVIQKTTTLTVQRVYINVSYNANV